MVKADLARHSGPRRIGRGGGGRGSLGTLKGDVASLFAVEADNDFDPLGAIGD